MLTLAKIKVYQQFNGDIDGWVRATRGKDTSGITDADWLLIDELRQGFALVAAGLTSSEFGKSIEKRLAITTENEQTREIIRKLAE